MKKIKFKCYIRKDNSLMMTIECYNREAKRIIKKQLNKLNSYIRIEEIEVNE